MEPEYIAATAVIIGAIIAGLFSLISKKKQQKRTKNSQTNKAAIQEGDGDINQSRDNIDQNVTEGSTAPIHTGSGDINIGISLEQYEAGLKRREREISQQLSMAHSEEKDRLVKGKEIIQKQLHDSKQSYETHVNNLQSRIYQLESIGNGVPDDVLQKAKEALVNGNSQDADHIFQQIEEHAQSSIIAAAEASYQRGQIARDDIRYQHAYNYAKRAVQLNPDNSLYLNEAGMLAQILDDYTKAKYYFETALEIDLGKYGENDHRVAILRNNIGGVCQGIGQHEKAINYFKIALKSDLKTYGKKHPRVANSHSNIGLSLDHLGQYEKAMEYHEMALQSDINTYGEGHPKVAIRHNNIGITWGHLGQYEKAIDIFKIAIKSDIETYGEEHPAVATSHNNIGDAWNHLGQHGKAIDFYNMALESDLQTYGEGHLSVATSRNNIGSALSTLGQHERAIEYYDLALASVLEIFGKQHPYTQNVKDKLRFSKQALAEKNKIRN